MDSNINLILNEIRVPQSLKALIIGLLMRNPFIYTNIKNSQTQVEEYQYDDQSSSFF